MMNKTMDKQVNELNTNKIGVEYEKLVKLWQMVNLIDMELSAILRQYNSQFDEMPF